MKRQILRTIKARSFALVVLLSAAWQVQAQQAQTAYLKMAPLDQYLMADRDAEIALARSAAPESISHDAEVMVLGQHGYETVVKGKNGFVAWWKDHGPLEPTIPIFGIPNCGPRSASTRRRRDPAFHSLSRKPR